MSAFPVFGIIFGALRLTGLVLGLDERELFAVRSG